MIRKKNYLETAIKNEIIFRMILDKHGVINKNMSIEFLYEKYSEGDRYGIWTILDFKDLGNGVFEFASEDIATLSGSGRSDLWTMEDGKLKHLENRMVWMS